MVNVEVNVNKNEEGIVSTAIPYGFFLGRIGKYIHADNHYGAIRLFMKTKTLKDDIISGMKDIIIGVGNAPDPEDPCPVWTVDSNFYIYDYQKVHNLKIDVS